jgi:LmbE family N-acetylglucosaminyl deacetylase
MLSFIPRFPADRPPRLLFLGAHSDDIEIGCGGTVLRLIAECPGAVVSWVVFSGSARRAQEARASAADFLKGAESPAVALHDFPDAFFPSRIADIKREFELLKAFEPDAIFTHCAHDAHQDHRVLSELAWNTFRDHFIAEYEVPKYDADLRSPNFFVPLAEALCRRKSALLRQHFGSQGTKHWFDDQLFMGLMRIRGAESRSPSGYAEGFYARKVVV